MASEEELDRFRKKYREHMEALVPFAERIDPHVYEVIYRYERAGSSSESLTVMRILDKPEMHEKGMSKMSMSNRTSKIASALLLLKEDPLMKLKLIGYWVATAFFVLNMLLAGIGELTASPGLVEILVHEGYPVYLLTILGVWKLLGVIALPVPGFPRNGRMPASSST